MFCDVAQRHSEGRISLFDILDKKGVPGTKDKNGSKKLEQANLEGVCRERFFLCEAFFSMSIVCSCCIIPSKLSKFCDVMFFDKWRDEASSCCGQTSPLSIFIGSLWSISCR